jgi:hypothetical protein
MRQHAVRVAGPDRIIFLDPRFRLYKNPPQSTQSFTEEVPQSSTQQTSLAFLCGFALCSSVLSVVRLLIFLRRRFRKSHQFSLTFAFCSAYNFGEP